MLFLVFVSSLIGSASTTSECVLLLYILHFESRRTRLYEVARSLTYILALAGVLVLTGGGHVMSADRPSV